MDGINLPDNFPVPTPVKQRFAKAKFGIYVVCNSEENAMTFSEFRDATQHKISNGSNPENEFWKNVKKRLDAQESPIYGIDNHMSLFPDSVKDWNLGKLTKNESLIHGTENEMPGILTPFLYNGSMFTCFAWHVEDSYAASVNILHSGESKHWYSVPHSEGAKLEEFSMNATKMYDCNFLLRHKVVLIPPSVLKKNGIKFGRVCIYAFLSEN